MTGRRKRRPQLTDGLSTGGMIPIARARLDPADRTRQQQATRHGLTRTELDDLDALERCWICGSTGPRVVDHSHEEAEADGHDPARGCPMCVRGMLCDYCNTGLGKFQDDPAKLRAAADYVEAHRLRRSALEGPLT